MSFSSFSFGETMTFILAIDQGTTSTRSIIFDEKSPLNPLCSYGKAKKLCEELIQLESPHLGIYPTIFRLPPVLNQSYDSGLGKLIRLSRFRIPIPILYQGFVNQRSFLSFNNFLISTKGQDEVD